MSDKRPPGHRLSERSDYVEAATQIHDPQQFHGLTHHEEPTPITQLKTPTPIKKKRKVEPVRIAMGLVLLLGVGVFAYRSVGRASMASKAAEASAAVAAENKAKAAAAAEAAAPVEPEAAPIVEATPGQAARSFALGEYERALEQYRYLAHQNPDAEVYAVMVKVLSARINEQ